jgi:hypothetical protein
MMLPPLIELASGELGERGQLNLARRIATNISPRIDIVRVIVLARVEM